MHSTEYIMIIIKFIINSVIAVSWFYKNNVIIIYNMDIFYLKLTQQYK